MTPLIETRALTAYYGDFQALFGVDMELRRGETVAIIGANGAGKTTLLRSIAGTLANAPGMVLHDGVPVGAMAAPDLLMRGIAMVPEGRKLFPSLTVEENLLIGAHARRGSGYWNLETVYQISPVLRERRRHAATALSGGQQQMVAIGRALMSNPEVLLCDEISLGLAPVVVKEMYAAFHRVREGGASVILVEQDISQALKVADRVYCMMEGHVTLTGTPSELTRAAIHDAYFGAQE